MKRYDHPERAGLGSADDLLDTFYYGYEFDETKSKQNKRYFTKLLECLKYHIQQLKALSEPAASQEAIAAEVHQLKSTVEAIEFIHIRPFKDAKALEFVSYATLTETVEQFRQQVSEILRGNKLVIPYLQTSVLLLCLSAKQLVDQHDLLYMNLANLFDKLDPLDPETLEHERMLYFLSTPAFDNIFELVVSHSDIFYVPEHRMKPTATPDYSQHEFEWFDYIFCIQEHEIAITRNQGGRHHIVGSIQPPKELQDFWGTDFTTVVFHDYQDEGVLVVWNSVQLLIAVLDIAALVQAVKQNGNTPVANYWIMGPKLPWTADDHLLWNNGTLHGFGKCVYVVFTFLSKLKVYFWSGKQQPNTQ